MAPYILRFFSFSNDALLLACLRVISPKDSRAWYLAEKWCSCIAYHTLKRLRRPGLSRKTIYNIFLYVPKKLILGMKTIIFLHTKKALLSIPFVYPCSSMTLKLSRNKSSSHSKVVMMLHKALAESFSWRLEVIYLHGYLLGYSQQVVTAFQGLGLAYSRSEWQGVRYIFARKT